MSVPLTGTNCLFPEMEKVQEQSIQCQLGLNDAFPWHSAETVAEQPYTQSRGEYVHIHEVDPAVLTLQGSGIQQRRGGIAQG
jgi:hypothetical protein